MAGEPRAPAISEVEAAIARDAARFDVPALIELLHWLGYPDDALEFHSHLSTIPAKGLVHSVVFHPKIHRVVVTVNIGMLSVQSPLPSYLLRLMDQPPAFHFIRFMQFIDHPLLTARFQALAPDLDPGYRQEWERMKRGYLRLLNLRTPETLRWYFRQVFPELEVRVRRMAATQQLRSSPVKLGTSVLGRGTAFGGMATLPANGVEIRLVSEESYAPDGTPWATEASRRMEQEILPTLRDVDIEIAVTLVLKDQESMLQLDTGHLLGYEPIAEPRRGEREVRLLLASGT